MIGANELTQLERPRIFGEFAENGEFGRNFANVAMLTK